MARHRHRHRGRISALVLLAAVSLACGITSTAWADDTATNAVLNGTVDASGALRMTETLTFASRPPASITQRLASTEAAMNNRSYQFTISEVTASAAGTAITPAISSDHGYQVIKLDTSKATGNSVTLGYTVTGASRSNPPITGMAPRTTVRWRVLQGLSVGIEQVSGTLQLPGVITSVSCTSGPPAAQEPCTTWAGGTHDAPNPTFTDGPRGPGEAITLTVGVPTSAVAVDEHVTRAWTLDYAFSAARGPLLAALLPLVLGGLALLGAHRRFGRDQVGSIAPTLVAEFHPIGPGQSEFRVLNGVRPGHVGTVADQRVDPVDVTGTLLDLAVRGHLLITELPRTSPHAPLDWTLTRREAPGDELRPFERTLLDAVAPAGGSVPVSQIGAAVRDVLGTVQSQLYADVTERGWFDRRPDAIRNRWALGGWVVLLIAVVATGLLVALTRYGLLGLALVVLGLGVLLVAQEMPRRTSSGTALLAGMIGLSGQLQTQPTDQVPPERAYEVLSRVIPYAVVLGGKDRWIKALADADDDPGVPDPTDLDWYHAPDTWHLSDLPASVGSFVTTVQGVLHGR